MSLPYTVLGEFTGSVQSASLLNIKDTSLFYVSQSKDAWFGYSSNDVIELAAYSTDDQTLQSWGVLNQDKTFKTTQLSYLNVYNLPVTYSYTQLVSPFLTYKNQNILLHPSSDLSQIGITDGTYKVSYTFARHMAGHPDDPLTIKEISPSRTEIKLIPSNRPDIQYDSFCIKKFPISDVSPVLQTIAKDIPYDNIFKVMDDLPEYQAGINYLKFAFFLPDNGSVVNFLKNMYEDYIKYSSLAPSSIVNIAGESTVLVRVQGIKTYFTNFLLQNFNSISDFGSIETQFQTFVNARLDQRFSQFLDAQDQGYISARQFCFDFFVKYFYENATTPLQNSYENKYFGYLKNVLNFEDNQYYQILNNGYLDERNTINDPITLVVKLASALSPSINVKDSCWVSNFSMPPYVFTAIIQNPVKYRSIKISPPNFGSPQTFINKENSNQLYSSEDLAHEPDVEDDISVNQQIAELNTDYSSFSNFVVFSSAATRLSIFKGKMVQWTNYSASLVSLTNKYNQSLSSSSIPYPYYFSEQSKFQNQMTSIVNSFDAYESYLFNSGFYEYNVPLGAFVSASYISSQDFTASLYDRDNKDSLVNNVPQYIVNDKNYSDYLTFLNMIGHHFDDIYVYISAMPIERQLRNQITSSIPTQTLKEMLYSFGWNVDDIIGSMGLDQVYLNSMNSASYDALSGQQRLQTIWNRILVSLPGIYKTKGTTECVNFLMSCYGLPSSMITVREYGGSDSSTDNTPTYQLDEKTYMLQFSGIGDYIDGPIPYTTKTVEFKFSINTDGNVIYPNFKFFPLVTSIPFPYSSSLNANWTIGFFRVPGKSTGQLVFQMGSGSSGAKIITNTLPIFNGDIFSVMLRRNDVDSNFQPAVDPNVIPLEYDFYVQKNENGIPIFYWTGSTILYDDDNDVFSKFGKFRLTNGNFNGTLDKFSIWDVAIDDQDFNEHTNDLNSYGYSGSTPFDNLWVQLSWQYPQSMYSPASTDVWVPNASNYFAIPNYYTDQTLTIVDSELWSGSQEIITDRWRGYYPTGSVEIRAHNFPEAIDNAFSASFIGPPTCSWFSQSVYPYHFQELTYQQDIDASKYGPNKFKNKKVRVLDYDVEARFDPYNRSTWESDLSISGESNQLGFFIDPQDSKNKDILRYVGKDGIMEFIGDPSNLFSEKYYDLKAKNDEYNAWGNKRTLFNEMLTVYKFYFDKSIFTAIKNVMPARANIYAGVIIEPTLLERPKYQNKPISSSMSGSYAAVIPQSRIYNFSEEVLWANFPTGSTTTPPGMPANYQTEMDISYVMDPTRVLPSNPNPNGNYFNDYLDQIQHNMYPDLENTVRNWETQSYGASPAAYNPPIIGTVSSKDQYGRSMVMAPDQGVYDTTHFFSGWNQGTHPTVYYMLKVWDKYYYYNKTGEYVRSVNPSENTYSSCSVYLYKYIIVNEYYMRTLIYFTERLSLPEYDTTIYSTDYVPGIGYVHRANTFLSTPDEKVSNIVGSPTIINGQNITDIMPWIFNRNQSSLSMFFELAPSYPRNHYIHKMQQFSKCTIPTYAAGLFTKGRQTTAFTVNPIGIKDGSFPVQSSNVSNINVVNGSNVIQNVPSPSAGKATPKLNGPGTVQF